MGRDTDDQDKRFVRDLLQVARAAITDPRVRVQHIHHPGQPPRTTAESGAGHADSVLYGRIWRDVQVLETEFLALWMHSWISDHDPDSADIQFSVDQPDRIRPIIHAVATARPGGDLIGTATDRLIVRGWIPEGKPTDRELIAKKNGRLLKLCINPSGEAAITLDGHSLEIPNLTDTQIRQLTRAPTSIDLKPSR